MNLSKKTKIIWSIVLGYLAITFLLGFITQGTSPLPFLMAENFAYIVVGALILQFIIYIINKFSSKKL